jgi:SAM-dependent methyltransferase
MQEASKAVVRRSFDQRFTTRYFSGHGIDIGCGKDSLAQFRHIFPLIQSVRPWDIVDGDAMLMEGVRDNYYDFVHSSHCLEHLIDPIYGLNNWIRICKPGGYLIIMVPDEDLYEQGVYPSTFNADHKSTFTISKSESWSPVSVNVVDLLRVFKAEVEILKIELLDASYQYGKPRFDQTLGPLAESAIEFILRKL